jgi:uncharacterized Zn-finger protein
MKAFELIETHHLEVACDGGGGALGHPRVYLHIDAARGQISCPYCSKTYVLKAAKKHAV